MKKDPTKAKNAITETRIDGFAMMSAVKGANIVANLQLTFVTEKTDATNRVGVKSPLQ